MEQPSDDLLPRFEIQGSYERFAVDKQPGPPESWKGATPGNTLAVDGHHGVLCHAFGRRHRAVEARAAQILANGFLTTYDTSQHEPAPERLTTAATRAYQMLEESDTIGSKPGVVIPGMVAACITIGGIDWLQIGQGWLFIQQHDGKLTELTTNEPDDEETEIQGGGLDGKWRSSWKDGLQPEEIARGTVVITAGDGINPAYIQLLVSWAGPPRTGGDGPNMQALACWGSRFPARARMDPPTAQHETSFMLGCPARAGNNPTGRLIDSRSCVVEPLPPAGGGRPVGGRPRTDSAGSSESRNLCAELGQLHSSLRSRSASSCRTRVPASMVSRETSDLLMPTCSAIAGSTFS